MITTPPGTSGYAADGFVARGRIEGAPDGPLAGVRLAVKDNIAVAGMAFTAGHPLFAARRAEVTAPVVQRLLAEGVELVGMTACDAGGFGVVTPGVVNPAASDRVIGGSSGGSAAALANNAADLALGTDTGGSVRIPAACAGLVGFKPSSGVLPTDGVWPLAPSLDHVGLMAREIGPIAEAFDLIADDLDEAAEPLPSAPLRIGLGGGVSWVRAPEAAVPLFDVVQRLEAAGHQVVPVPLPDRDVIVDVHGTLCLAECRAAYAGLTDDEIGRLGTAAVRALTYQGTRDIAAACAVCAQVRAEVEVRLQSLDALLLPTLAVSLPEVGARKVALGGRELSVLSALIAETCLANLVGCPAISFPCRSAERLDPVPFSVQLLAPSRSDRRLLALAALIEDAVG